MILARVRRTLRERALLMGGERVLVACSGGPDSAALLDVLSRLTPELSLTLFVASVDHGLRADAARDVETAAELARRLGVPFAALRVHVPSEGASILAKARRARYEALLAHREKVGAELLAVGHTRDDQAETVLLRAIRGSGVLGLSGVDPRRADGVIRPLIDCSRTEVHEHVEHHGLPFVRDPSNEDPSRARTRERGELLPALVREDPRAVEHLARLADDARALRALVRTEAEALLGRAARGPDLEASVLMHAPPPIRAEALAIWVRARTDGSAGRAHLEALERTLAGRGDALLPGDLEARLDQGVLRAVPALRTRPRGVTSKEKD